ncbi:flocculation protein FLO11-like protein [Lates japonicus]|uniref:Flocculation protein FLO11-like protein n=1 Tax=Lates japonicus TaxID=270547 RepID=A0AAD3NMR7_LATJO|nr:flocculation protein FLO11-like protein [Lates japonicus]
MKARPEDLRPPCFLSTKSRPQPPSQGRTLNTRILPAPQTQALEGVLLSPHPQRLGLWGRQDPSVTPWMGCGLDLVLRKQGG